MKANLKNIEWVDGVKAFAIIAILLNHFVESFGSVRMETLFPQTGELPVRIIKYLGWLGAMAPGVFFLLSGLTLTISSLNKPIEPINFYWKRLLRIYPLYIAIHLIFLFARYGVEHNHHFTPGLDLLSLLGLRFTDSLFFYLNPSWWFIWAIIQMYLLFPFLLIFLKKQGVKAFLLITFLITILSRLSGIMGFRYSHSLYYWMTGIFAGTRLFEFTFGMFLGYLLFNNNQFFLKLLDNTRKLFFLSFFIYVLGFIFLLTHTGSLFLNIFITIGLSGLFYSIYELIFARNSLIKNSVLWIGKNSFSVFLIHQPFMMHVSVSHLKGFQKGIVLFIIIILSFVVGHLIDKFVTLLIKQAKQVHSLGHKHPIAGKR